MDSKAILKPLKFKIKNREYNINWYCMKIIKLAGDSAVGKSLFVSDFLLYRKSGKDKKASNSLVINSTNPEGIQWLKTASKYDYVIIDNAEGLITPKVDKIISNQIASGTKTYWIIIGRTQLNCTAALACNCRLECIKEGDLYRFQNIQDILA